MGRLSLCRWGVNLENGFLAAADESILQLYRWRTVIDPLHAHHAHVPSAGLVEMRPVSASRVHTDVLERRGLGAHIVRWGTIELGADAKAERLIRRSRKQALRAQFTSASRHTQACTDEDVEALRAHPSSWHEKTTTGPGTAVPVQLALHHGCHLGVGRADAAGRTAT